MITKALLLYVFYNVLCIVSSQGLCGPGEVYTDNYMPLCEPSCQTPNAGQGQCFYLSKPGCKCAPGLYRASGGNCVTADYCWFQPSVQCGPGEVLINNFNPNCEKTCQNPNPPPGCDGGRSSGVPGCVCTNGMVQDYSGRCVNPAFCSGQFTFPFFPTNSNFNLCGPNEEYTDNYMPKCEPTCHRPNPGACYYISNQPGCKCKSGYKRDSNGACISFCGYL